MNTLNPHITVIAAISKNRGLGHHNQLLWKIPQDLSFFKKTTSGSPIIMGNTTYASIGRPLPNRLNIVVSRTLVQQNIQIDGCAVMPSIEEAILFASNYLTLHERTDAQPSTEQQIDSKEESIILANQQLASHNGSTGASVKSEIFIIGGAQIYAYVLDKNIADRVILTEIDQTAEADVFFPVLDKNQWQEVWRESHFDENNGFSFDFVDYRKLA